MINATGAKTAEAAKAFNLFDLPEDYYAAPYDWFATLRAYDPVHRNADGTVLLTRYEDVHVVWWDIENSVDKSEMFSEKFGPGPLLEHHTHTMLFRDPPDHDRLRMMVNPFFSRRNLKVLEAFVSDLIDQMIAEARERETFDFVKDFAFQIPMTVICRILGVPKSDRARLHALGMKVIFPLNPNVSDDVVADGHAAVAEFKEYLRFHLREREKRDLDPDTDILSTLLAAKQGGGEISEDEILHMCIVLLNGGHETTTNTMSVGLNALLEDRDSLVDFRDNPDIGNTAADELIRFITPIQLQGRRTSKPVELPSGETLPAETEVILCPASANRDESKFEGANSLNLRRTPNRHFSFGAGVHLCIGRLLAKMQIGEMFPKLFTAFPEIEKTAEPEFNRNARFRGLQRMPVRVR
ncbi:MAG: cytochrome P450 [Pseudomonadota bacterium]